MSESEIRARIAQLTEEIAVRSDERSRLNDMLEGPRVRAVAHYMRYHHRREDECDSLEEAVGLLRFGSDNGELALIGVSVGGAMTPWDEFDTD